MLLILNRVITRYKVVWFSLFLFSILLTIPINGSISPAVIAIGATAALLSIIKIIRDKEIHFPILSIILGIYVLYLWFLVPRAPLPINSLNSVLLLIPILLIFLVFVFYIKEADTKKWENALIALVVLVCTFESGLVLFWLAKWVEISGSVFVLPPIGFRIYGVILAGSNFAAAFVNLVSPFIALRFILAKRIGAKRIWAFVFFLTLISEFFSSSRGGWVGGIAAIGASLILYFYPSWLKTPPSKFLRQSAEWTRKNFVRVLLLAVLITVVAVLFLNQIQITQGHYGLLSGREHIWANAWQIWSQSFYLGNGPGSFPSLYADLEGLPPGWLAGDAHNLWLQVAAEGGLIGLFFSLALTIYLARTGFRVWNSVKLDNERRASASAYLGIGIGVFVSNLSGFFFQIPIYAIVCLLLLSLFLKLDEGKSLSMSKSTGVSIVILTFSLFAFGTWFASRGVDSFAKGREEFLSGNLYEGMNSICDSALQAPDISIYKFQCGLVAAQVFSQTSDPSALEQATQATKAGLAVDPYWPVYKANLAILEWQSGERMPAMTDMEEVVHRAPNNALLAINLGWMAEQLGFETLAQTSYQHALLIDPWLSLSDFFKENQLRQSVVETNSLPDEPMSNRMAAFQAIQRSDFDAAAEYLQRGLNEDQTDAEAIAIQALLAQKMGEQDAWFLAQKSIFLEGENPRTLVWAAQIAREVGEEKTAALFTQRAFSIWSAKELYDTETYYYFYDPSPFGSSYIPGYVRADISQETIDAFLWLADHYHSAGQFAKEQTILIGLQVEGVLDTK